MKIKLDENIPIRLAPVSSGLGHDVDAVPGEKLTGQHVPNVWAASQNSARFLVTQDLDFFLWVSAIRGTFRAGSGGCYDGTRCPLRERKEGAF